jgi:hypothetical protein
MSKARAVIELVEMPSPQRKAKTVPELVEGPSFDYPEREQNHERSE